MPRKKKTDEEPCSSRDVNDQRPSRRKRAVVNNKKKEEFEDEDFDEDEDSPPPKKKFPKPKNNKKVEKSDENEDPNKENSGLKKSLKIFTTGPVVRFYEDYQFGKINNKIRQCLKDSIINQIKSYKWYKAESCFDRRVTFIEWHPTDPKVLAVASKSGDIILWNYENPVDATKMIKGSGAGGSIQALRFDPFRPDYIYTVSIEGKFLKVNFNTKQMVQYLQTNDFKKWYCSCDINFEGKVMVAGDNKGILTFLTTEGEPLWEIKGGKTKITHAEFSKREPWLLCTSTGELDKTFSDKTMGVVKLWDIRNMSKDKANEVKPLHVIREERALNAAYFSLTDGNRLLTTDQGESIKVYRSPLWYEETSIVHPHRQFQHLTQIRAYWHPLEDIIICGRYPNPKHIITESDKAGKDGTRSIDFFDADTGKLLHQHTSPGFNGIYCLNRFNHYGDALASGTGTQIVIWRPDYKEQERSDNKFFNRKNKKDDDDSGDDDDKDDKKPPKNLKNTKNLFNKTNLVQREPVKTKKLQLTLKKKE